MTQDAATCTADVTPWDFHYHTSLPSISLLKWVWLQAIRLSSNQRSTGSSSRGLGVTTARSKCFLRNNNADRQMDIFESDSPFPNTFQ